MRGGNEKAAPGDVEVQLPGQKKLAPYDLMLRRFEWVPKPSSALSGKQGQDAFCCQFLFASQVPQRLPGLQPALQSLLL